MYETDEEELLIEDQEKSISSIDEVLQHIGEFERYQWFVGSLLCLLLIPVGSQVLMMYFAALNPRWQCVENSTYCTFNGTMSPHNMSRCNTTNIPRSEWRYTRGRHYSIVTEFDLHCGTSWLIDLSTSILFVGQLFGAVGMGWLADEYGRLKTCFFSTAMVILLGSAPAFMGSIYAVIVLRFFSGVFLCGAYQSSVLLSEIVASRYRPISSNMVWSFYSVVLCILGMKAYFIQQWRILMLVASAPYVCFLAFYFLVPESPRWLLIKGKEAEMYKTLHRIAKVNKKKFPKDVAISYPGKVNHKSNPLHLFRSCSMAKITVIMGYGGFSCAITYYGLSLIAGELGGSVYINFILFSLSEFPGNISSIIFSTYSRKKATIISIVLAGIACASIIFLPQNFHTARIAVGMTGKLFVILGWNSLGIWIMELFPTTLRSQAFSISTGICTIGSASAPWMVTCLQRLHRSGPFICMSSATVSCALLLGLLRDTKGLPTLECEKELVVGVVEDDSSANDDPMEQSAALLDDNRELLDRA